MNCRFCSNPLSHEFIDLINSPPSNSFLTKEQLNEPEIFYPLKLYVCDKCFLVQIDEYKKNNEIFHSEYAYFSSVSTSWLKHCEEFVDMIVPKLNLSNKSKVIEIASNDGYLLQYFNKKGIPCMGIEPSSNTAKVAIEKGIDTRISFFSADYAAQLVEEKDTADLIIGNNVLAHVPNLNDFVKGLQIILQEKGTITLEFPHILQLIRNNQFDTIYHEHYSYFSLYTIIKIFNAHNLSVYDVEELPTHGGSLRIYVKHNQDTSKPISLKVKEVIDLEIKEQLDTIMGYQNFQIKTNKIKFDLLVFLLVQKKRNKKVIAYGAAAKGNTLLNFCGIKGDLIKFVVDKSPHKQRLYLPASHIPILEEKEIKKMKPEYILVLAWNIMGEIIEQLNYVREWDCKFVVPIPQFEII